jgi:hypothetical protein
MKKLIAALSALLVASPAWAGVGATASMTAASDGTAWAPSIDYRGGGWLVQVHALDLIGGLPSKMINTGVDVTTVAVKRKVAADVEGVVMPGGSARLAADTGFNAVGFNLLAQARMGAEIKQGMGFGVYVVPQIGISNIATGKVSLAYGGGLQVSAWFSK